MSTHVRHFAGIVLVAVGAALVLNVFVIGAIHVPSASMEATLLSGDFVFVNKLIYGARSPKYLPFSQSAFPFFRLPKLRDIDRGDVLVFELPANHSESFSPRRPYFVKRCVAVAGDTLELRADKLFINGDQFRLPGSRRRDSQSMESENYGPRVVPKRGEYVRLTGESYAEWTGVIRDEGHSIEKDRHGAVLIDGKPADGYTIERNYLFVIGDNLHHSYDSRSWGFLPEENVIGEATVVYWSVDPSSGIRWSRLGSLVH
jgi:signal peptidase I